MTVLSVNVNKIALIRNSRGGNLPDLVQVALDCETFGAQGITVHPRPDERHIRYSDIPALKAVLTTEFNIEGNPTPDFMQLVGDHIPAQCTLVPDPPGVLTSDSGWDTLKHGTFLQEVVQSLHEKGIRVSIFIDPDPRQVEGAKRAGADRIELYTGQYASLFPHAPELAIAPHIACAQEAANCKIGLNAGHDLNLHNLGYYKKCIPNLLEVSIGHALVCDALYYGLHNTIQQYLHCLK